MGGIYMDNKLSIKITNENFESIKHADENGTEFQYARELQKLLNYTEWRKFENAILKSKLACQTSNYAISHHFVDVAKTIKMLKGAQKVIQDYKLTRYACYLIAQNSDPRKEAVALAQTYFAVQTRKMELTESEYENLTEDEKRLYRRRQTKDGNIVLYKVAKEKGVKNFDRFTNAGYKGLYNGETAKDIAKRKVLIYRKDILDYMGSAELGANVFRITQTEALLKKQSLPDEQIATNTHYKVGRAIRNVIKELGGTMPEELETPKKALKFQKKRTEKV